MTRLGPKSVLYIQVLLYDIHYVGSQECPLYPGSTVQHPLCRVPRVPFISRFYCTTSTRLGPKSVLYIQVRLTCVVLHPDKPYFQTVVMGTRFGMTEPLFYVLLLSTALGLPPGLMPMCLETFN